MHIHITEAVLVQNAFFSFLERTRFMTHCISSDFKIVGHGVLLFFITFNTKTGYKNLIFMGLYFRGMRTWILREYIFGV